MVFKICNFLSTEKSEMSFIRDDSDRPHTEDQRVRAASLSDASSCSSIEGSDSPSEGYCLVGGVTEAVTPGDLHQLFNNENNKDDSESQRVLNGEQNLSNDHRMQYSLNNVFDISVTSKRPPSKLVSQAAFHSTAGIEENNGKQLDQTSERCLPTKATEPNPFRLQQENIYNTLGETEVSQIHSREGKQSSKWSIVSKTMFVVLLTCIIALICIIVFGALLLCRTKAYNICTYSKSDADVPTLCINCSLYENLKLSNQAEEFIVYVANEKCCLDSVYIFQRLLKQDGKYNNQSL